jgi:hypothetical protein
MGKQCLKYWEADGLAKQISTKAMEHLLKGPQAALNEALMQAYEQTMLDLGLTLDMRLSLEQAQIMQAGGLLKLILITNNKKTIFNLGERCYGRPDPGELTFHAERIVVSDPDLVDAVLKAQKALEPITDKLRELKDSIQSQITGRSVTQIMKFWPEVSPFVRAYFNMDDPNVNPLVTPFEALLGRFLALPAPSTEQVAR